MSNTPFTVASTITSLSVTVTDDTVTGIQLDRRGRRPPGSPFEKRVARELIQYFEGVRTEFTFPVHLAGSAFERRVWSALKRIPYGQTRTYGEVARAIGRPGAARAVGTANGRNPVPIVIPCHRVVAAGGKLGGFGGGLSLKKDLLRLEASHSTLPGTVRPE